MNKKISMFQINNFKDEKFRDTIKKNYCRLRQKSSNQLGEYLTNQPQNQYQNKIQKSEINKEITKKIKECQLGLHQVQVRRKQADECPQRSRCPRLRPLSAEASSIRLLFGLRSHSYR